MQKEIMNVDESRGIIRVTTTDERWYAREGSDPRTGLPAIEFVPSCTWIADHYPKGIAFYKWLGNKGWDQAEAYKVSRGDRGSKVHVACADLMRGQTVSFGDSYVNNTTGLLEPLTPDEYECVMTFAEWHALGEYEIVAHDDVLWNEEHRFAGTRDIKARRLKDDRLGVIDIKTGANVWPSMELQVSAYRHSDPECSWQAILQLGYQKNKKQKFKFTEVPDKFELFLAARKIWENECAGVAPLQKDYPLSVKL